MLPNTHTVARLLTWLAAIATPLQGMPSTACGCSSGVAPMVLAGCAVTTQACCPSGRVISQPMGDSCPCTGAAVCRCGEQSSCCQQKADCCGSLDPNAVGGSDSCCSRKSDYCGVGLDGCGTCSVGCSCGDNCQCRTDAPTNQQPATPPAEESKTERVISDLAMSGSLSGIAALPPQPKHVDVSARAAALPAVDRCVSLCCFRL